MGSIYVTGDTHGPLDLNRLVTWQKANSLSREDYLIVAGDFGLLWSNTASISEVYWTSVLSRLSYTILFCCGNHENHYRLQKLPLENKFGGVVGKISDNIFYLKRGEIYTLYDKKILAFGGATSYDKHLRKKGIDWWLEEVPSYSEMDNAIANLEKHNFAVDYILAHTCPHRILPELETYIKKRINPYLDPTYDMLEHLVSISTFHTFLCGHWHIDYDFDKYRFLYHRIIPLLPLL